MIGLCFAETLKLIGRKRWLAFIPGFALTALLNLSTLSGMQVDYQLTLNVWDGVFGSLGGWLYFRLVLLLLFTFLVADSVLEDSASNWVWLTLARSPGRGRWWAAKAASLFIAALVYFALGTIIVFLVSLIRLPYAPALSPFATGSSTYGQGLGIMVFPEGASPWLLSIQFVLYSAFACGAFALIPVTVSLVIRNAYVAPLIPFVWVFLSHLWQSNRPLFRVDLIPRLFYGMYFHPHATVPMSISSSLLYLASVGVGFYLLGTYAVRATDF